MKFSQQDKAAELTRDKCLWQLIEIEDQRPRCSV